MMSPRYDVIVVGAGAAGLSGALVLGRARRRVAVVDAGSPRNAPAAHMQGFLSRDGMRPADFLAAGRSEVTAYGVDLIDDHVVGVEPGFSVALASGRVLEARRILIATGVRASCQTFPELGTDGAAICSTVLTAMGGRSATSPSGSWGHGLTPCSMPCWFASGRTTSSSSCTR